MLQQHLESGEWTTNNPELFVACFIHHVYMCMAWGKEGVTPRQSSPRGAPLDFAAQGNAPPPLPVRPPPRGRPSRADSYRRLATGSFRCGLTRFTVAPYGRRAPLGTAADWGEPLCAPFAPRHLLTPPDPTLNVGQISSSGGGGEHSCHLTSQRARGPGNKSPGKACGGLSHNAVRWYSRGQPSTRQGCRPAAPGLAPGWPGQWRAAAAALCTGAGLPCRPGGPG